MKDNQTNQNIFIIDGNECKAIQYDADTYLQPFFTGQSVGWVRSVFIDPVTRRVNILLITPEDWHLWYEIIMGQLRHFGVDIPEIGTPMYFLTYQMKRCKDGSLPYTIEECSYCWEYMASYSPPDFMGESQCLIP